MAKTLRDVIHEARSAVANVVTAEPGEAAVARRLERELDDAVARLEGRADKDLIAIVCHDLKDPLASIVMGSGFLKKTVGAEDAAARRVIDAISRSADRMNQVVGDFHDLSKIEAGTLVVGGGPCDLVEAVRAGIASLEATSRDRGVPVEVEDAPSALVAPADRARVAQIVGKLVGNAIKFSRPGGRVVVRVERDGTRARVVVRDTGRGIAAARLPTIFDRAVNARQSPRDGPGLGLALAQGLARLLGGEISAQSTEGEGSTFCLMLPAA